MVGDYINTIKTIFFQITSLQVNKKILLIDNFSMFTCSRDSAVFKKSQHFKTIKSSLLY